MEFISVFFIILSLFVISYFIYIFKSGKRISISIEILAIIIYIIIILLFLFPNILNIIEITFGISSAINFIIYLSIFISYFIIFLLYKKLEGQRVDISKLVQEISFLKNGKK